MKLYKLLGFIALIFALAAPLASQTQPTAAWQVARYDITATIQTSTRALSSRAQLSVRNVGRVAGSRIFLRINPKAEIKSVTVNDATVTFRLNPDTRTNQQRVEVTFPSPVAPSATVVVAVDYVLPIAENDGLASISPLDAQFLPLSQWYPSPGNPLSPRGPDTAPFRLRVTGAPGETVISSGKSDGGTLDQSLYGQPFFLVGSWDTVEGAGDSRGITALLPKGAGPEERKQAEALIALAGAARTFYAGSLGAAPDVPLRLIAVTRGAGFSDGGTLLLDTGTFRRSKIDSQTAMRVAETVARVWIGGAAPVRGEGAGVLTEGLVRYLATLFLEKQFGLETAEAERMRQRTAFAAIAKRDAPLAITTPAEGSYYTAVGNKGAMAWRLIDRTLGREAFMEVLRTHLQEGAREGAGITLAGLRQTIGVRGGDRTAAVMNYVFEQPTDIDLLVGAPVARGGEWTVALRNTGSLDVVTSVEAVTETGQRLKQDVTLPARNFGEAVFKTAAKLNRVEIDPEKIYPQSDYANDFVPRSSSGEDALTEALRLFVRQDYARAETLLRDLLMAFPNAEEPRVLLARTLLSQNKSDLAEKEFKTALELRAPTPATVAWAGIGLGEINLQRGQAAQAARHFDDAVRADAEYATTLAARAGRLKAEAAAKTAPAPDESARAFIAQFDKAILSGRKVDVEALIVPGELVTFAKGVVASQPELWQTRLVRTEPLDATRLAVEVVLDVKQLGREQSGTALLILTRMGGGWKLAGIEYFEVR